MSTSYEPSPEPRGPRSTPKDDRGVSDGAVSDRDVSHRDAATGRGGDPDHRPRASGNDAPLTRHEVVAAERQQFGGIKIGSAFFGWLTATGTAVLLTALLAAAGGAVGVATGTDVTAATRQVTSDARTVGLVGGIVLLVILFVAYCCGGYVAGRMARFNGLRQGLAVWLWAVLIAALVALAGAIAGSKYDVLATLNSFPRIPVREGDLSTAGIIAVIGVAVTSLVGAVLGGLAGMRFHRRVDKAGFGEG